MDGVRRTEGPREVLSVSHLINSCLGAIVCLARTIRDVELCGVVLADGSWRQLRNVSSQPATSYEFDSDEWRPLAGVARVIWHTHPSGDLRLSPTDLRWADRRLDYLIICPHTGDYRLWTW